MTSQTDSDSDLKLLRETVVQVIADHVGRRDTLRMVKTANYGEGLKFADFGADVRWTTRTQALLNDWNEQGRCVGGLCVQLRGGTGIGALPLPQGVDLVSSLSELGLDRVRRLDLSIDVFDCPSLSVPLFRDRLSSGDWRIPRRDPASFTYTGPIVDKAVVKKGATLYIGGIGDDKRIAIYDKGAQQELDKPWIRFEVRLKGTPAEDALYRLRQASDAAQEHHDPQVFLDGCVVALVRAVLDVRDVSAYAVSGRLPKNWANAGTTTYPEIMHPVFAQVAPLELGSFKATGLYAARVRHLVHSSGRMMWRLCLIAAAKGDDPGVVALTVGAASAGALTGDDFQDMSQMSGIPIADLEVAELLCVQRLTDLNGLDLEVIASDRTRVREELVRSLGGV